MFQELIKEVRAFKTALAAGNVMEAWRAEIAIQRILYDIALSFTTPTLVGAAAPVEPTPSELAELQAEMLAANDECGKCQTAKFATAESAADGVTPKGIDPATILLIFQLVSKLVEAWRKRRNPTA